MSITSITCQHQTGWEWHHAIKISRIDMRSLDLGTSGRTDKAQLPALLHEHSHRVLPHVDQPRQVLHQQGHRHIEWVHPSTGSYLHPKGLQYLGDDEYRPHLLLYHYTLGTPQHVQPQIPLDQLERHLDVPPPRIHASNVLHRQLSGIKHIGDVTILGIALPQAHHTHS